MRWNLKFFEHWRICGIARQMDEMRHETPEN